MRSIESMRLRSNENARTRSIENFCFMHRLLCYSMVTKFFEVLLKKVHRFASFFRQLHQFVE